MAFAQTINAFSGGGMGDGAPVATAAWFGAPPMVMDGNGGILIVESAGNHIRRISPAGNVSTWAGPVNPWYHGSHPPQFEMNLSTPTLVSTDGAGTVHVYEFGSRRLIEIAANGSVRVRADSAALGNRFYIQGLVSDPSGNLFLSVDNMIWRLDQAGVFTEVAGTGTAGYSGDGGPATSAMLSNPLTLARAADGTLYVADHDNGRVRRITPAGEISTLAEVPSPQKLLLAADGDLYVSSRDYRVRRITPAGVVTVVAGNGENPGGGGYTGNGGPAVDAALSFIGSLAFTASGDLLISHAPAVIRRVDAGGIIHPWSGELLGDGLDRFEAAFGQASAMATDAQGNIFLAHTWRIRKLTPAGVVSTVAGRGGAGSSGDGGPALEAVFRTIDAMVVDPAGNIYFSEPGSHVVRIVRTNGIIDRVAGNGSSEVSGDGGPALDAGIPLPKGLALDGQGRLYIASRRSVRRVELDGSITTFAGGLDSGFYGDGGPATQALFCRPGDLAFVDGALLIADECNQRVRRVDAAGIVTTIVGNGNAGRPVEGVPALHSGFSMSGNMAAAGDGSLFLSEPYYRRIYRIGADGVVRLAAGNGQSGYGGDGGPADQASFTDIGPVTADASGALFVGELRVNLVRKVTGFNQPPATPVISIADASVLEGDTGTVIARFAVSLDRVSSGPVGFRVRTESGTALVGTDLIAADGGDRVIAAGQLSAEIEVEVIGDAIEEPDETFRLVLEAVTGAQIGRNAATGLIADNDNATGGPPGGLGAPLARADRRVVAVNAPAFLVEVLDNDDFDPANLGASPVAVVGSAQGGQATAEGDAVRFTPQPGFAGEGGFRYRLCDTQSRCTEAAVAIVLRPIPRRDLEVLSRSGRLTQPLQNLPAMPAAVFRTTPLAAGKTFGMAPSIDTSPASPWDSTVGRTYQFFFLDRDDGAQDVPHIVHVDMLQSTGGEKLDLYLGFDVNGDGWPQEDEVRCIDVQSASPSCDALMPAPLADLSRYWVMVHNRNPVPASAELVTYDVPLLPSDGSLVATGPGKVPANEAFDLLLSWRDLSLLEGERRLGYVWLE
ncbi:MAG: Ig-like domain-containing protein, partial [Pseudomonadota bacterium]